MRTVVISDLHLGSGGVYEAFAGAGILGPFLDRACAEPTRVIVNGDAVDFLMNDDTVAFDPQLAVEHARNIVEAPASAEVFQALGRVLGRGGEVIFRLGNHDVELALPEVAEVVRSALRQPAEIADRLVIELGDQPRIAVVGGTRILVTHGDHADPWNRVDYRRLDAAAENFERSAGSRLVKQLMNPVVKDYGLRFINLLKPDFQGGLLTALAVAPGAVKTVFRQASLDILWHLFRGPRAPFADPAENEAHAGVELGLAERVSAADLSLDEREALEQLLTETAPAAVVSPSSTVARGRTKLARAALRLYAGCQRRLAGPAGSAFFELEPGAEEWTEARRLADKAGVGAVVLGHTHAARWRVDDGLVFANTGTWIWLMRLPSAEAPLDEWLALLDELDANPTLELGSAAAGRMIRRATAVLIQPATCGATLSLLEVGDAGSFVTLAESVIRA